MNARKKISIKGEVVGEPSVWTANSGTACCKFAVRTKEGLFEAIAFHEKANIEGLATGCTVSVRGSYRDTEAFESKTITVDTVVVEGGKVSARDAIIRDYGSMDKYIAAMQADAERKTAQGLIRAKSKVTLASGEIVIRKFWFHSDRVCRHPVNGDWWLKIDLCMDVLGADFVTREIAAGISLSNPVTYRDVLEGLLIQAEDKLSQEAPF